jgi:hypothetical protein
MPLWKGGVALWKRFVCAKQGWRKTKELNNEAVKKRKRNVKISRHGCEAMIDLKTRDDGKYVVARLILQHTHHSCPQVITDIVYVLGCKATIRPNRTRW